MFAESRTHLQSLVVGLKCGKVRSIYVNRKVTIQYMTELNVSQRKIIAGKERMSFELFFCNSQTSVWFGQSLSCLSLVLRRPNNVPKHWRSKSHRDIDLAPLDPTVYFSSFNQVKRPKFGCSVPVGQITQDASRFPQRRIVTILDHRNRSIGIQFRKFRCIGTTVTVTNVVASALQSQFSKTPHESLDIR